MRHFLNINSVNESDVLKLIQRALAFKSGVQPDQTNLTVSNLFLKILHVRIAVFRWQKIS